MKHTAVALMLATLLLAATPALAKPKPSAPPTYLPSVVMPYNAYAPIFVAPVPEPKKNTGASNPDRPDPTRNTPGAEAKSGLRFVWTSALTPLFLPHIGCSRQTSGTWD